MDNKQLGDKIVELVGGEENIQSLIHCNTRLRFKLADHQKADQEALGNLPDVLAAVDKGGQFQVVIGNKVGNVYSEIMNNHAAISSGSAGTSNEGADSKKAGILAKLFEYLSGTFSPLLPALAGAGMIKALLALLDILNWIDVEGTTYAVLDAASSSIFYFLPIFVGISAAKQLGANPFVGGVIAAALLEPNFTALLEETGDIDFMGIPLIVTDYSSTVFPLLIAMAIYAPFERFLKRISPDTIQLFFVSMVGILVMVPLTALVFGPFGEYISTAIAVAISFMLDISPVLTGIIFASAWPFLVVLGVHWGIVPIMIDNFSHGGDMLLPITAGSTFAQIGIAFGIFLRARNNKDLRSLSLAATLSGLLAGVTEPILYGLIMRYRRLIPLVLISGAVGGAITAVFDVRVFAFVLNSIPTIPAYTPTLGYIVGIGAAFIVAAILAFIFGTEGRKKAKEAVVTEGADINDAPAEVSDKQTGAKMAIPSPIKGKMIPLEDVDDPVFSSATMGKGVGVEPTEGIVVAPFDGKIATIFPSKHAIGLVSEEGIEVLIHIGLDTVQLEGNHFEAYVETDSVVKKGDTLVTFDIQGIKDAGYQITTPVIITNTDSYSDVLPADYGDVNVGEKLLTIVK